MDKVILTPEEAISCLNEGEYIHSFANPVGGMMFGCDFSREATEKALRTAHQIEVGGPGCMNMGYGLAVWESPKSVTFFEADTEKLKALEKSKQEAK